MTDDDKKTSEVEETNENTELEVQLSELQAKADEYLDSLQRERASFANYKRRIDQENSRWLNDSWASTSDLSASGDDSNARWSTHPPIRLRIGSLAWN